MNIASLLVEVKPENMESLLQNVASFPWAEVHHTEKEGRMIVTVEGETSQEDVANFKTIKSLPGVISASLVEYCFEEEKGMTHENIDIAEIPEYLQNEASGPAGANYYQRLRRSSNFSNPPEDRPFDDSH
ncbi:MAG: chaperone NapD [Deltaproteobacteria bacterium]|jgi:periplasmic nitrate reductase NapD|nr:chaperone NapD [Deltaproteobacteria bacterium]MBT4264962.1 chaperone NapD [Deltaproteobacteria bacterium]MBT4642565.1 chaperone NapD [Deltaproteobacteria bacterium]MBT6503699.1 chaperone NapD [Deltaproteobacteria bacterium]MBT6616034.1 chaperone NapD [Deltaproteobacteria bacterium]